MVPTDGFIPSLLDGYDMVRNVTIAKQINERNSIFLTILKDETLQNLTVSSNFELNYEIKIVT